MIKKFFAVIVLGMLVLNACTEEITDAGDILIPPTDKFDIIFFDSDSNQINQYSEVYKENIDLGAASRILLGKFENIKSSALLKFFIFLPDSLKDPLANDSVDIIDSWINLPVNYIIGDTNSVLNFTTHKITSYWLPADFNIDSLNMLQYDAADIATIVENSDSLISFKISGDVVYEWMKKKVDDTLPENNGILLQPDDNNAKVIGFQGLSSAPGFDETSLRIVYRVGVNEPDTIYGQSSGDVHVLSGTSQTPLPDRIYLQSGFTLRSKYLIDDSVFPRDAIINKAEIIFYMDSLNTIFGTVPSDSIMVQALSDSTDKTVSREFRNQYLGRRGNLYQGDITTTLQSWINGTDNQGVILRLSDDLRTLNKVVLYGPASTIKKPRIIVYYTDKH